MQTYTVTRTNKMALMGRIKKFWESCANKNHCYKVNGKLIFPFLTDEQIKDAQIFAPIKSTCKFNGLRLGDTVRFYGGNRIIILGKHDKTEFIRVVPKGDVTKTISGCITSAKHLLQPKSMYDRLITTTAITRSSQELREHPPLPKGFNFASSYEVPSDQSNIPVIKYEDLPDDLKLFFWDGKEPITKLSDVEEEMTSMNSATRAMFEKIITGYIKKDLGDAKNWRTNNAGFPIILDSLPALNSLSAE